MQGNIAVATELFRMDSESSVLTQSHLANKNVSQNLCEENERDCAMIQDFNRSNQQMRDRLEIEQTKVMNARALIKLLKQQLIRTGKERDQARTSMQIERKQLDKHRQKLALQKKQKGNMIRAMKVEMCSAYLSSASAKKRMSPVVKKQSRRSTTAMIQPFKSIGSHYINNVLSPQSSSSKEPRTKNHPRKKKSCSRPPRARAQSKPERKDMETNGDTSCKSPESQSLVTFDYTHSRAPEARDSLNQLF